MLCGRSFAVDAYLANLITGIRLASLPDPADHEALRVFLPANQRRAILQQQRFELIDRYRARRIYPAEIAAAPQLFTMIFRASMVSDLADIDLSGAGLIYALWPGYLERDRIDLRGWA